jgi:hypothetical protein
VSADQERELAIMNACARFQTAYAESILANMKLDAAEAAVIEAGGTELHLAGARVPIDVARGARR